MFKLDNVALLSINTHNPEASVKALRYSSKEIQFKNIKILSHRIPNNLIFDDAIEFCKIPKFNLAIYLLFKLLIFYTIFKYEKK